MSRTSYALAATKTIWRDPQRKPLPVILAELAATATREREVPVHYVSHMLYKKGIDPRDYIGHSSIKRAQRALFEPRDPDLDDKVRFAARAERLGVPIPTTLATTTPGQPAREVADLLRDALERSQARSIFVKPADGISGKDCYRIDASTTSGTAESIAARMAGGVFLLQETLVQHPQVAAVHADAVNCARIHTIRRGGEVEVLPSLMRFGVGTGVVDTPSGGAVFVPVDLTTGRTARFGYTNVTAGASRPERHPTTGVRFADVTLPFWDRTLELVNRAANGFDKEFVGWDVAFTTTGPVFTEGNSNPRMSLAQIAAGGFRADPAWWRVLRPALKG